MKASILFALQDIRHRPRRFLSLSAASAAILITLIMMLFYLNADWKNRVLPERPENYHFTVYGLTQAEKDLISSQPWVQVCYDDARYLKAGDGQMTVENAAFHVRVIWEERLRSTKWAWGVFDEYDLWERDRYRYSYQSVLKDAVRTVEKEYFLFHEDDVCPDGNTVLENAALIAQHRFLMSSQVKNIGYCQDCIDSYVIRPEFLMLLILFSLFLGGAMMILQSERYRSLMTDFGILRSYGFRKRQIYLTNLIYTFVCGIVSLPVGILTASLLVRLYTVIVRNSGLNRNIYLTFTDSIPWTAVWITSALMLTVSLLGAAAVCRFYQNRTVEELLKREGSVQVSFVSKTSTRFERAKSERIYSRLQFFRTRMTQLLSVGVTAIMLPLPVYYLHATGKAFSGDTAYDGFFYLFLTLILLSDSAAVIYIAARSRTEDRHAELGVLRSLGCNRKKLRFAAYYPSVCQILTTTVPAVLLYLKITDTARPTSGNWLLQVLAECGCVILLTAPPVLFGTALSLYRFRRRSVIDSICDSE